MKLHKFEVTNRNALTWFVLYLIGATILSHLDKSGFDWDGFAYLFGYGLAPILFIMMFGKRIDKE